MSKGFVHDPLVDIERIRRDLDGRYRDADGSVILKELIQNAEDAGARRFVVGWTPGIPESRHPLLRGPALVAANDGPFKASDQLAIRRLGLSEKLIERGSIGKFGLGLKSVFHWCEAFCYLFRDGETVTGDILNPWSGDDGISFHQEWDTFDDPEIKAIQGQLDTVVGLDFLKRPSWFALWIPLRRTGLCAGLSCATLSPFRQRFYGDEGAPGRPVPPAFLRAPTLARQLAETLPLLTSLEQVQIRQPSGQSWEIREIVCQIDNGVRRRYVRGKSTETFWLARIAGELQTPDGQLIVRGRETLRLGEAAVARYRTNKWWPKGIRRERDTHLPVTEEDKAGPHGAAVFIGPQDVPPQHLRVSWATFLPLSDTLAQGAMVVDDAHHSIRLLLHGDFFVDAGRRGPDLPAPGRTLPEAPSTEEELSMTWNQMLVEGAVMPNVLPALDDFCAGYGEGEARALTQQLLDTFAHADLAPWRPWLWQTEQWVFVLGPKDRPGIRRAWMLRPADLPLLNLPAPPEQHPELPWQLFKAFDAVSQQLTVTYAEWPRIGPTPDEPVMWPAEQLVQLVASVAPEAFADPVHLAYLARVLAMCPVASDDPQAGDLGDAVVALLRRAVQTVPLRTLRDHRDSLSEILGVLGAARLLPVRLGTYDAPERQAIARALAAPSVHLLILPEFLASAWLVPVTTEDSRWSQLADADALQLLQVVSKLGAERAAADRAALVSDLTVQLLRHVKPARISDILGQLPATPLFRAFSLRDEDAALATWGQIEAAEAAGLLFGVGEASHTSGLTHDVALALQRALGQTTLLRIDQAAAEAIYGEGRPDCTPREAAHAVRDAGNVHETAAERVPLLRLLLSDLQDSPATIEADDRVRAARYLLHAAPSHRYDTRPIYTDDHSQATDAWVKLARVALSVLEAPWRLVSSELAALIPPAQRGLLGLKALVPDIVADLIREASPERVDCYGLNESERDEIIRDYPVDRDTELRQLAIHAVLGEDDAPLQLTAVGPKTFLLSDFAVDPLFHPLITLIRQSSKPPALVRQRKIIPSWTGRTAITVALDQPDPWTFALAILPALGGSGVYLQDLSDVHRALLKEKPWLLRRDGTGVAPADVLEIKGMEDQIAPLVVASGGLYADRAALHPDVVKHSRYDGFVVPELQPQPPDVLTALGEIVRDTGSSLANYHIGQLGLTSDTLTEYIEVLRDATPELAPALPLIERAATLVSPEACAARLLPALMQPMAPDRLARLLGWIVEAHQTVPVARRRSYLAVYERHLAALVAQAEAAQQHAEGQPVSGIATYARMTHELRLMSVAGSWQPIDRLCPYATNGIDDQYRVEQLQGRILNRLLALVAGADSQEMEADEAAGGVSTGGVDAAADEASVAVLRAYFQPWGARCPRSMIAGFLALLGDGPVRDLAEEYFDNRGMVDITRDKLHWEPRTGVQPPGWAAATHPREVMATHRFAVSVLDPGSEGVIPVRNLLGREITVPATQRFEHLVVGDKQEHPVNSQNLAQIRRTRLRLRRISLEGLGEDDLKQILKETGRLILEYAFLQPSSCASNYWDVLGLGEQRDIRIAQVRLTEAMFLVVRQLGLSGLPELRDTLRQWDAAGRRRAELDDAHGSEARQQREQTDEELRRIRHDLSERLCGDASLQQQFLAAVRDRIQNHYQYVPASIPFELFQNADDATVELLQLRSENPQAAGTVQPLVQVVVDAHGLTLFHWGRPINHFREGGADGRDRGFDADLEKMLTMTGSDKGQFGGEVTGRFGLGFKSVFLLTDRPEVVSGRIAFDVVGGLYPRYLAPERHEALRRELDEALPNGAVGTVIHLPAMSGTSPEAAVSRFEQLAHVLVAFARVVKQVEVRTPTRQGTVTWSERPLPGAPGACVGRMRPLASAPGHALVLRGKQGAVLFGIGRRGVEPLPVEVPTIWVTAPTGEAARLGFAVNARFQLDVGRAQLARDSAANHQVAAALGAEVAEPLAALARASAANWAEMRDALSLDPTATPYEFWDSIWQLCASGVRPRPDAVPEPEAIGLVRRMLWGTTEAAMTALVGHHSVAPSGLPGVHHQLTRLSQIRLHLAGCLTAEGQASHHVAFGRIAAWPRVRAVAPTGAVVSGDVAETLRDLAPASLRCEPLTLASALGWEIAALAPAGDHRIVGVEAAGRYGLVVTRALLQTLSDALDGSPPRAEWEALRGLLATLAFETQGGRVAPATEIVVAASGLGIEPEERLRAAFAPPENILLPALTAPGAVAALEFFLACRRAGESLSRQIAMDLRSRLARWVRAADGAKRHAAVIYLARGEHRLAVATELRVSVQQIEWLRTLTTSSLLVSAGLDHWEQRAVLAALRLEFQQPIHQPIPPRLDPGASLERIADWWEAGRHQQLPAYLEKTFPGGRPFTLSDDWQRIRQDAATRKEWLKLFLLGATFTMGRQRREQHRGFLAAWERAGWLDVFALPQLDPRKILDLLREHLGGQVDAQQYYAWYGLFVPAFQFSTWLDTYAWQFLQAARQTEPVQLATLLTPSVAPGLTGTGIEAPSLRRTLGIGACFVAREIARSGIGGGSSLDRYCYVPTKAVRGLMDRLGCDRLGDGPRVEGSAAIHDYLTQRLGAERARFGRDFDIPLLIVAEDTGLQQDLFHEVLWDQYDVQDADEGAEYGEGAGG